jgi:hypothetical protein
MIRSFIAAAAFGTLFLAAPLSAQVSTDLWDVSQGATVNSSSGGTVLNMFGGTEINFGNGSLEPGTAFLEDAGRSAGFVHFVEFESAAPIRLTGYHLLAGDDNASNPGDRGFTEFRLYAFNAGSFQLIDSFTPASNPYPGNSVDVTSAFAAVEAQLFRAEFVQFANDNGPGPRIIELDAIATPVPEPGTLAMILAGGTMFLLVRRRK